MNLEALRQFLVDANIAGYAGGDERTWGKEADGSTTISFARDAWRLHDNFFGGEPYGGRTVVFHEDRPVWMMVYYGCVVEGSEPNWVYGLLRRALMQMPADCPLRGPEEYGEADGAYRNAWEGDVGRFSGEEQIVQGAQTIYRAQYSGGFVDQRRGV